MSQGYSSGGSQKGSTPLSSQIYSYDNFQGGFANFIQKEVRSHLSDKEVNTENITAAFNSVIENIKNTYKQANNLGDKETSPALEKLVAELNNITSTLSTIYKDNTAQHENQGTLSIADSVSRNPDIAAALKDIKGTNGTNNTLDSKAVNDLAKLKDSPIEKLLVHAKTQNGTLDRIEKILSGIATTAGIKIPTLLMDLDAQNDKDANAKQAEEEDWFAGLGSTISKTIFNHPGVNKLGLALGQLGNLALIKGVLSNRQFAEDHPVLHKAAALAVYFQLPQLAVNLMGVVFQQAVSNWLVKSIGPQLGKGLTGILSAARTNVVSFFSNLGPNMAGMFNVLRTGLSSILSGTGRLLVQLGTRLLPLLGPLAIAAAIIAGGIMLFNGAKKHIENMKANDARIDSDSSMTQSEKDKAKLGAHFKSGVKNTALPGALVGAAIGSIIPGVGTAIGAVVGGLIGLVAGPIISVIKPLTQMFQHAWPDIKASTVNAFKGIGSTLKNIFTPVLNMFRWFVGINVNAFKWMFNNSEKIMSFIKPIMKFIGDIVMMLNPIAVIFRAIKAFIDLAKTVWPFNKGSNNDNGNGTHTIDNPESTSSTGVGSKLARAWERSNIGSTNIKKDEKGNYYVGGHLMTSTYGNRVHPNTGSKYDGKQHFHKGIDLAYNEGEKVGAFVGGTVTNIVRGENGGYGNTVEITDAKGVVHKYHHGSKIADGLKVGQKVSEGDHIMNAGKTGYATGTHLDYETWQNGKTRNPLEVLAERADEKAKEEKEKKEEEKRKKEEEKNKKKDEDSKKKDNEHHWWSNIGSGNKNNGQEDITSSGKAISSFTNDKVKEGGNG